jgi:hypothetical protein
MYLTRSHARDNACRRALSRAGSLNAENNLRHDWHSLLTASAPSVDTAGQRVPASDFLFTERNYSSDYYPHADTLVRYLQDFALRYKLNIKYSHRALSVYRTASAASSAGASGMDADAPSPSARQLRDMAPADIPPLRIEMAVGENTPGATVCVRE